MSFWCERAWLPDGLAADVRVDTADGTITRVRTGFPTAPPDAARLTGVVLPGFANAHSHAFHRALRGRTNAAGGDFWSWRKQMYAVAARLDPDLYLALARATYAEMALAGVTCVGEFHYVHHAPGGAPYATPNVMTEALRRAAADAGVRLTVLDTCYLAGGPGEPLSPQQQRFSDGDASGWARRHAELQGDATTRIGAAIHSVRAVPPDGISQVVAALAGEPLHTHLSEQTAENDACRAAYGATPAELLAERGALGPETTVVHATHLQPSDIDLLGTSGVHACLCPTTERDLADGIGPARELHDAGVSLCLGSDQHTVIDPLEEARAMDLDERLLSHERGRFGPGELVDALTWRGHTALGWQEAGSIAEGAPCDLVAVRTDTVRTAGVPPQQIPLVAASDDVDTVVIGGRTVVAGGHHLLLDDVPRMLQHAITDITRD